MSLRYYTIQEEITVAVGNIIIGGDIVAGLGVQIFAMPQAQYNQIDRSLATHAAETRTSIEGTRNTTKAINGKIAQLQRIFTTNFNQINRHPLRLLQAAAAGDAPLPVVQPQIVRGPEQRQPVKVQHHKHFMNCAQTLLELWREWQFGIGGRKAACLFTAREHGRCKSTFCRRKAFWEVIVQFLTRRGQSSDEACNQMY